MSNTEEVNFAELKDAPDAGQEIANICDVLKARGIRSPSAVETTCSVGVMKVTQRVEFD